MYYCCRCGFEFNNHDTLPTLSCPNCGQRESKSYTNYLDSMIVEVKESD